MVKFNQRAVEYLQNSTAYKKTGEALKTTGEVVKNTVEGTGNVLKSTPGYLKNSPGIKEGDNLFVKSVKTVNAPLNIAADGIAGGIKKVAKYNGPGRLTKKTDPGIQNLWTGRREGGGAIAIGAVAGAGYMGYNGMKQTALAPKTGEMSYSGTAPIMNADGVGNESKAPTLGAGGNMVFGLHNARKG